MLMWNARNDPLATHDPVGNHHIGIGCLRRRLKQYLNQYHQQFKQLRQLYHQHSPRNPFKLNNHLELCHASQLCNVGGQKLHAQLVPGRG
jgi:hypothetical protein